MSNSTYVISQIFGASALVARPVSRWLQSHFPDTKNIRLTDVLPRTFTSISYALNESGAVPAIVQGVAAIRAGSLSTLWGQTNKKMISAAAMATSVSGGLYMLKDASDLPPIAGAIAGTAVDFQDQARYHRLPYLAYPAFWGTTAIVKENWAALASDIVATGILWKTVYNEDIKGASGKKDASFNEDWKAYWYGILHNAPTGATIKGQVSTAPGYTNETMQKEYLQNLQRKTNPHFLTQNQTFEMMKSAAQDSPTNTLA
ncbi:MAG TPA: hypothetical protein DEA55_07810 [Rhodospirillaceae bacterium]|nr:hypothetical protein [Rhodospirillaceae bacterium]